MNFIEHTQKYRQLIEEIKLYQDTTAQTYCRYIICFEKLKTIYEYIDYGGICTLISTVCITWIHGDHSQFTQFKQTKE